MFFCEIAKLPKALGKKVFEVSTVRGERGIEFLFCVRREPGSIEPDRDGVGVVRVRRFWSKFERVTGGKRLNDRFRRGAEMRADERDDEGIGVGKHVAPFGFAVWGLRLI